MSTASIPELLRRGFMRPIGALKYATSEKNEVLMALVLREHQSAFTTDMVYTCLLDRGCFHLRHVAEAAGFQFYRCSFSIFLQVASLPPEATRGVLATFEQEHKPNWSIFRQVISGDCISTVAALINRGIDASKFLHGHPLVFFAISADMIMEFLRVIPPSQLYLKINTFTIVDNLCFKHNTLDHYHSACKVLVQLGADYSALTRQLFTDTGFSFDDCLADEEEVCYVRYIAFFECSLVSRLLLELQKEEVAAPQRRLIKADSHASSCALQ